MEHHTRSAVPPTEFNVVLERLEMSPEQWQRVMKRLLWKEVVRRLPKQPRRYVITFSDQPDFFIVDETKG